MSYFPSKVTPQAINNRIPSIHKLSKIIKAALKESQNLDISVNKLEHSLARMINAESARDANLLMQLFDAQGRSMTGALIEDTGNDGRLFIAIYDDLGTPRLPLTELPLDESSGKISKKFKRIRDASGREIPWVKASLNLNDVPERGRSEAVFNRVKTIRERHPFKMRHVLVHYDETSLNPLSLADDGADGTGATLSFFVPGAPYLPMVIRYRLEANGYTRPTPDFPGFTVERGTEQSYHDFHILANAGVDSCIPLQLLDTAFKYQYDEIQKDNDGLRPSRILKTESQGPTIITGVDSSGLPEELKSSPHYKLYQQGEMLPDGGFFLRTGDIIDIEGTHSYDFENVEYELAPLGDERKIVLDRRQQLSLVGRLEHLRGLLS